MSNTPTPHNSANIGDFAKVVIMPGDPLRAKMIAKNFLNKYKLVNDVRGIQGYTGYYKGTKVSVMASGMGAPSMGIYSYELFNYYGVDYIIRVGSAGGYLDTLDLGDIVIGEKIVTDTNYRGLVTKNNGLVTLKCDEVLRDITLAIAKDKGLNTVCGKILSTDTFYESDISPKMAASRKYLAVEMESGALYYNADTSHKHAITICTISDLPLKNIASDSLTRQNTYSDMITLALDVAKCIIDSK